MTRIDELKQQLIDVLTEMNKIKPVQFLDIDCDGGVYNFSDVAVNEKDDRVYVKIAMWHDNLPAHEVIPIKDSRGHVILPEKKDETSKTTRTDILVNVRLSKFNALTGKAAEYPIADSITKDGLVKLLEGNYMEDVDVYAHESLAIKYYYKNDGSTEYYVSVKNKTSDVLDEWFDFKYSNTIIKRSVMDDKDYGPEYWNAKLEAEDNGEKLSQVEFMEKLDAGEIHMKEQATPRRVDGAGENSGGFLRAAAAMSGE